MVVSLASTGGATKVYTVNGGGLSGKSASAWLEAKIAKKKKRNGGQGGTGGEGEIRLIQDFDFPEASNKIKTTPDGQYLICTGTYKPRIKVFDLEELSLKTERVTDSENIDFCTLSSDWTKTLHLQADRSIELHTQSASHYRVRTPRHGRSINYHFPTCDAIVGGQGGEVWRLNLEIGRFMKSFHLEGSTQQDGGELPGSGVGGGEDVVTGVNVVDINKVHQLLSFGTETASGKGTVEMWDPRSRSRVGLLRLPYSNLMSMSESSAGFLKTRLPGVDEETTSRFGVSVTSIASKPDGLNMAVGTSTGHVLLYDLRANKPYVTKDQGYGQPIKKIEWVQSKSEENWISSVDANVVKIWDQHTGKNLISINSPNPINDMHVYPSSGLMFLTNEASPMTAYYIPQLGPAPKWARFLDNMTEEMEEDDEVLMYDDFKFVDRHELEKLNLEHLIGTEALKPYMHGFFVDLRLYTKARAIANPFAYAEHRERLIKERIEKEQESRIRAANTKESSKLLGVKVNKKLAKKLAAIGERTDSHKGNSDASDPESRKRRKKNNGKDASLLTDDRFGALFTNPDFEIDEYSREFALLNPSTVPSTGQDLDDEDEEEDNLDEDSDSSVDGDLGFDNRPTKKAKPTAPTRTIVQPILKNAPVAVGNSKPKLYVSHDSGSEGEEAVGLDENSDRENQTFGRRLNSGETGTRKGKLKKQSNVPELGDDVILKGSSMGGIEMSFVPSGPTKTEKAEKSEKKEKKAKEAKTKGQFGSGMENRRDGQEQDGRDIEGEARDGRTRRRQVGRAFGDKK